jgi:excisionase family DNA binding protein
MADEWLTLEEAAAYLKVSKPSIYRYTSEGKLPFYKLAGSGARRFKRSDLDALLEPGLATPGKVGVAA